MWVLATSGKEESAAKSSVAGLSEADMVDLQAVHDAVAELVKHFWTSFPPTTPELSEKVMRLFFKSVKILLVDYKSVVIFRTDLV